YLDFDNLPDTNFTCAGKVIGGYYADLETSCQMFHVCTETRVCERVDEVDCTKSEKFYSLNLELYGSTLAPPTTEPQKSPATEQPQQQPKPSQEPHTDPPVEDLSTTTYNKPQIHLTEVPDSTEDPYYSQPPTTTHAPITTTVPTRITTRVTTPTTNKPSTSSRLPSLLPHLISSPSPILSSLSPPASSILPSVPPTQLHSTLDPTLLSPQEFIYRYRGPGSEAISFQSFRPADGVYITHAPPQQYDHFQYESSRTAPRPTQQRPTPFVQRQPAPFRPTTLDPRDQLLRPGPTSLPSERHETSVKHRQQNYPASALPAQRPLPFNPFYYDRKRSDDSSAENESSLSARSVAPPTVTERPPPKPKSPPRVIVTASASVSDSNGKRLNYTVGNVVSAVKPIVPINYDDYKESDLLFDPFFLDVPKLQKRRKTRSNINKGVFSVPATVSGSAGLKSSKPTSTVSPVTSRATTINISTTEKISSTTPSFSTTTATWNPDDYVDDNYEPHAYIAPIPPIAVLVPHDIHNYEKERQSAYDLVGHKNHRDHNLKVGRVEYSKPTSASALVSSSQSISGAAAPPAPAPSLRPVEAPACAPSHSPDCRTRA
ncbi:Uncharacterized protein OBRU01_25057, partial [Operophtera brumata]